VPVATAVSPKESSTIGLTAHSTETKDALSQQTGYGAASADSISRLYFALIATFTAQMAVGILAPQLFQTPYIFLILAAYAVFSFLLASRLGKNGWVWGFFAAIPIVNLVVLVVLLRSSLTKLKEAGFKVGLFGAKRL
jgi:hypothetical protein